MIKILLIDIGKTIITNEFFDFKKGVESIYEYTTKTTPLEEFHLLSEKLYELTFDLRKNTEVNLTKYIDVLIKISCQEETKTLEELEDIFLNASTKESLIPGVYEFLDEINKMGILIVCVSNSCFSSRALTKQLDSFGVTKFIAHVISSCDTVHRKPNHQIFDVAINYSKSRFTEEITNDEIIFIGNDYEVDMKGSHKVGIKPVWFNQEDKEDKLNICFINENNYKSILFKIKQNQ